MLTEVQIRLVKSTVPLLESAGVAVTEYFYNRMFNAHPELLDIFNMSNQRSGRQQFALFSAVASYARHIDDLAALREVVERVANKHTSLFIQPQHYDIVGHHLIATLKELAPDAFTAEVADAWTAAYALLAGILSGREQQLYTEKRSATGGWYGPKPFKVIAKTMESELVCSFVFAPVDGQPVLDYLPGQYLGVKVKPPLATNIEIRQYSLSDRANGQTYRISVKHETLPQPGLVSNYLHDEVQVGDVLELLPPAGDFYLQPEPAPTVLISAGVGLTPMLAMLETLVTSGHNTPVWFLHACENRTQHSFVSRLHSLAQLQDNLQRHYWYQQVTTDDLSTGLVSAGLMDLVALKDQLPRQQGQFYLCGPAAFMQFAKNQLLQIGVSAAQIHYEVFGPHSEL
ncbi:NO-inducible flavohemoprotein [Rheinheimera sp. F8]|uniref:NO-inducible flavohemoprotein n=1 Tax=Rheinheimera sp. F8 TaxID=1763998 RepID=UPI000744B0B3|nr:NO-inducible flavohemoprotein [Rheinheimera sp. F8]ALZ74583.1 flavohemoprotein [Rheinheimera sp. F8]